MWNIAMNLCISLHVVRFNKTFRIKARARDETQKLFTTLLASFNDTANSRRLIENWALNEIAVRLSSSFTRVLIEIYLKNCLHRLNAWKEEARVCVWLIYISHIQRCGEAEAESEKDEIVIRAIKLRVTHMKWQLLRNGNWLEVDRRRMYARFMLLCKHQRQLPHSITSCALLSQLPCSDAFCVFILKTVCRREREKEQHKMFISNNSIELYFFSLAFPSHLT